MSKDLRLFGRYQKGSTNPQKKSEIWGFTFPFAFLLFTWQEHRCFNFFADLFADVAAAVHAIDKEEIGFVILIEKFCLFFSKLPIVTDIAAIDTDLMQFLVPFFSI